jgi:hypothetical protein
MMMNFSLSLCQYEIFHMEKEKEDFIGNQIVTEKKREIKYEDDD